MKFKISEVITPKNNDIAKDHGWYFGQVLQIQGTQYIGNYCYYNVLHVVGFSSMNGGVIPVDFVDKNFNLLKLGKSLYKCS